MNFKSTLWALAFACVAVSCSDDVEDGLDNGNNGSEAEGDQVYLTVNIASASTGAMTKANGEDSGSFDEGSEEERKVHDINIYLIEASATSVKGAIVSNDNGVTVASTTSTDDTPVKIVGHGYSDAIFETTGSVEHHTANSVSVKVDKVPTDKTVYHVFAVTNLGKSITFNTLHELRDAVSSGTDWLGTAWSGSGIPGSETTEFIMSTHQMYDTGGSSSVEISSDNTDENNPAKATVYVERLAARIDMQLDGGLKDGTAQVETPVIIEGATEAGTDFITLTGYQVINRWNGDNYLIKRVTEPEEVTGGSYPTIGTNPNIQYLGDEVWGADYNYVLDPLTTTDKNAANMSTIIGDYESHYDDTLNDFVWDEDEKKTGFTAIANIKDSESGEYSPIVYTKENTLDLNNQILGLTTGVIFKGIYEPSKVSKFDATSGKVAADNYTDGGHFYVVNDFMNSKGSRYLCGDLKTIGALSFPSTTNTDIIKALFAEANDWGNATIDELKTAINSMVGGKLNKAYQAFLKEKVTDVTINLPTITDVNWDAFLATLTTPGDTYLKDPATTNASADSELLLKNYNIAFYKGGECYYRYLIRHAIHNGSEPAPMEFCIVRNNVYQLKVTGVQALGEPLPFTDPEDTPDKEAKVYLTVQIYVKNWVVRNSGDIIL